MNKSSEGRLAKVHPELTARIRRAASTLSAQGITIEVVQGLRTYAEQNALYAQGRTKPGKKVTNAKGGASNHNFGLAVDVCPFVSGKPNWDASQGTWDKIGDAGKAEGLEWGGDWSSLIDLPHLQIPGLSIAQCRALYDTGGLSKVWAAVTFDEPILDGAVIELAPEVEAGETTSEKVITTTTVETPEATIEKKSIVESVAANSTVKEIAGAGVSKLGTRVSTGLATGSLGSVLSGFFEKNMGLIIFGCVLIVLAAAIIGVVLYHRSTQQKKTADINSDRNRDDVKMK